MLYIFCALSILMKMYTRNALLVLLKYVLTGKAYEIIKTKRIRFASPLVPDKVRRVTAC